MNAPARITQRPLVRPSYTNAPVSLETFERWAIVNYHPLRRYWLELQEVIDTKETTGEFLEWAQCQYDIAKSSQKSPEPQQPMPGSPALVEGSSPTAGPRTAGAGTSEHDELVISQYRQAIYAHERLIDKLYDFARAERWDELHDLVRAEYLSIHGPRD
jgi:hypothetical protein